MKLDKAVETRLISSIQTYFSHEMDEEIGNLQAAALLDFMLQELGPLVYNQAIGDAQKYLHEKALDLPVACYQEEFTYVHR